MHVRYIYLVKDLLLKTIEQQTFKGDIPSDSNAKVGIFADNTHQNSPAEEVFVFDLDDCMYISPELQQQEAKLRKQFRAKIEQQNKKKIDWDKEVKQHGSTKIHLKKAFGVPFETIFGEYELNDFSGIKDLTPDKELKDLILSLPGPKICFTNGFKARAEKILKQIDLEDCFQYVFCCGFEPKEYVLKPKQESYELVEKVLKDEKVIDESTKIHFFDDRLQNIIAAIERNWISHHVTHENDLKRCIRSILKDDKKYYPSPDKDEKQSTVGLNRTLIPAN